MECKIQNIVFPTEAKHQQCKDLFYHGENGYLDREKRELFLKKYQNVDFSTYLNGCSYGKWKKYTKIKGIVLCLDVKGDFSISILGYKKPLIEIVRTEFLQKEFHLEERQIIRLEFPESDDQILGFELSALGSCTIYGGYYAAICEEEDINPVCLSLATTTCHKEAFIKKNVELLKHQILELDDEISKNFYIHVVDNGRTLSEEEIQGRHVYLHPNNNTGGSGGFARGMIESLNQTPKATHVLLMDDDVLVLPESIIRTYKLLTLLKDEYKDDFISGAMLYYEKPNRQHEDIGTFNSRGEYETLKPRYNHNKLKSNLDNEGEFNWQKNQYAGWWYCCIPAHVIEKNGLPLPVFIRCDDSEYSLRCKANIITMNGICIWHMGFSTKYNAAFDLYQQHRNFLIGRACSNAFSNANLFDSVCRSYRIELLKFNYDAVELIIRAFEDFLKGPDFLKKDQGEAILKENTKLNEQMVPLDELDVDIPDLLSCYDDQPRKFLDKWLLRITYNGQRFWRTAWCKKDYAYVAFDHTYQPQKMAMHNQLIAVNPFYKTGRLRKMDKARYRELQARFRKAVRYYKKHHKEIEEKYRKEMKFLTSEEFWRKYLKI